MAVRVKDPTDIQGAYDELGNPNRTESTLHDAETQHGDTTDPWVTAALDQIDAFKDSEADKVAEAEKDSRTQGGWVQNVTPGGRFNQPTGKDKFLRVAKKGGPWGAVIGLLIAGAATVSFFGGPGLLIVNFAEVLAEKFNYQLGVMESRNTQIIQAKLNNTTKGCALPTSMLCKFSTFSDREIANFEQAGLRVNKSGTGVTGRTKISSFEIDIGNSTKTIKPSEFKAAMKQIPEFSGAMKRAYNMKALGTSDSVFIRVLESYKSSKAKPFSDSAESDSDRAAELEDKVKNGSEQDVTNGVCKNADSCTDEEKANNKKGAQTAEDIVNDAADSSDSTANRVLQETGDVIEGTASDTAEQVAAKIGSIAGDTWKVGTSAIKVTGVVDDACMVYGWVKAFSLAAKVVRSAQLVRFAMVFLTTASMIKAGDAKPEDVSYLGTILTTVMTVGNTRTKAATDSLGYRYAAFGDTGATASSTNAVIGATFPKTIQSAIDAVTNVLGSRAKADSACGFLANPFVQAGSLIIGIASFFVGIGEVKLTAQAALLPIMVIIGGFLPPMLGEMLAGKAVTSSTVGEVAGDMVTSGTGALLSKTSTRGGNAILKREQASAYMNYQQTVAADYADYERSTTSPLDASNPNTFLGSIYTKFAPYLNQANSASGAFASIGSVLASSMRNLIAPTAAADKETYAECKDPRVEDLGMATDPYCNPVTGIPTEYLDEDPITVYENLVSAGDLDANGNVTPQYQDFLNKCVDRENPYGTSGADQTDDTDQCFITSQRMAERYLYQADQRVINVRENDVSSATASTTATGTCPTGTSVVPITEGWDNGTKQAITLCGIPSLIRTPVYADSEFKKAIYGGLAAQDISTHAVNATATDSLLKLISRAKDDGKTIVATFSYRSYNEQKAIRAIKTLDDSGNLTNTTLPGNYSSERAKPGYSNHQMGLSLDFTDGSKDWIKKCIANNLDGTNDGRCYGFYDDVGPSDPLHFTYKPA